MAFSTRSESLPNQKPFRPSVEIFLFQSLRDFLILAVMQTSVSVLVADQSECPASKNLRAVAQGQSYRTVVKIEGSPNHQTTQLNRHLHCL